MKWKIEFFRVPDPPYRLRIKTQWTIINNFVWNRRTFKWFVIDFRCFGSGCSRFCTRIKSKIVRQGSGQSGLQTILILVEYARCSVPILGPIFHLLWFLLQFWCRTLWVWNHSNDLLPLCYVITSSCWNKILGNYFWN